MERLISNTAFGELMFNRVSGEENLDFASYFRYRTEYDNFLKQPLELWMFVPCDKNGNVLEELNSQEFRNKFCLSYYTDNWEIEYKNYCEQYQQAKERCYFDGLELSVGKKAIVNYIGFILLIHKNCKFSVTGKEVKTIEDLVKYNLTLT